MDRTTLIADHPKLFHMAEANSWDNIRRNGLLSTRALVDLCQPDQLIREAILNRRRTEPHKLTSPGLPLAVVRDQKPLRKLKVTTGTTEQQFFFEAVEDFETRRQLKEGGPVRSTRPVEFTVLGTLPDIDQHVVSVHNWIPGHLQEPPLHLAPQ